MPWISYAATDGDFGDLVGLCACEFMCWKRNAGFRFVTICFDFVDVRIRLIGSRWPRVDSIVINLNISWFCLLDAIEAWGLEWSRHVSGMLVYVVDRCVVCEDEDRFPVFVLLSVLIVHLANLSVTVQMTVKLWWGTEFRYGFLCHFYVMLFVSNSATDNFGCVIWFN